MGPRPDGRGEGVHLFVGGIAGLASMGPRPDGRGEGDCSDHGDRCGPASMGPRPDGRGEMSPAMLRGVGTPSLQWGRDLTVAESRYGLIAWTFRRRFNGAAT